MAIKNNLPHLKTTNSPYHKGLPINVTDDNPSYVTIIDKTYRELTKLIALYTRTVFVRIDLHPAKTSNPLTISMTKFCRSFQRQLETKYKTKVAYQWVQESGKNSHNKGIHWHLWVGVKNHNDYKPKRQTKEIYDIISKSWSKYSNGSNAAYHMAGWFYVERNKLSLEQRLNQQQLISSGGDGVTLDINIIRERLLNQSIALGGVIDECFYAFSYLAKVYSKVRTDNTYGKHLIASSNISYSNEKPARKATIEENLKKIDSQLERKLQPLKFTD